MSATQPSCPHTVPWRAARLLPGIDKVAHAIFGIQAPAADGTAARSAELVRLFDCYSGPQTVERASYVDPQGFHCEVFLAYWLDDARYRAWADSAAVSAWWDSLSVGANASAGVWRELMIAPMTRFQYGAGNDELAGLVTLSGVEPSSKFGYWGGYRDRIPASATDKFLSPLSSVPDIKIEETRGRRVRVVTPDNLCYLREGQGWDKAGQEERSVWKNEMEKTVENWVATLRDEPARTGCLSVRFCQEREWKTGRPIEKQSQVVFALSLHHVERAARTVATHLAVKDTFTRMHAEATFEPRMHIWVEMFILKAGELTADYVNCHPRTGLLPYFAQVELAHGR